MILGGSSRSVMDFMVGVVSGLALGYVFGLLMAPDEGAASRARLQESAEAWREAPRQVVDEMQLRVHRAAEAGRQAAAETRAELESASGLRRSEDSSGL